MRLRILILTLFLLLAVSSSTWAGEKTVFEQMAENSIAMGESQAISYDQLQKILNSGEEVVLLDVRDESSYEHGHIKGAVSLALDKLNEESVAKILSSKKANVIVYCQSFWCPMSLKASETLHKMGYTNVLDYKGGIKEWQDLGQAVEQINPSAT